jgi:cobalt/nickel transport system permease protein
MHIPDGFLSVPVSILFWVISALVVAYALRRVSRELDERRVPLLAVLAAVIFAGQMLNFSVTGGTSGHLLGATLAAILLGPWAAIVVMTSVVSIQALLFQDGGLLVLGANLFNMAIVGVFVGYGVYQLLSRAFKGRRAGVPVSGFVAAWVSIVIASLACALQLAVSGTSPANIAVPAMGAIHALIGIGEGLITAGALAFVLAARPDLVTAAPTATVMQKALWIGGVAIAVILAVLSPLASGHPDGLEWVAERQGFLDAGLDPLYNIIPDYVFPGIANEQLATIAAGIVGVLIVLAVAWLAARGTRRRVAQS